MGKHFIIIFKNGTKGESVRQKIARLVHLPDMIYHIVVGDQAAKPLREAVATEESMQGQIVVLKDLLNLGPLQPSSGQSFSALRSRFWEQVSGMEVGAVAVDDLERLLELSNELQQKQEPIIWMWLSPLPADICAYYWMLHFLKKHKERIHIVNIAGLPFLDENGKVFFPKSLAEAPVKELIKARKLARAITSSEFEIDGEEWAILSREDFGLRILDGGKKLVRKEITYYDDIILGLVSIQPMKASRLLQQVLSKHFLPVGDVFLSWRIREMIRSGRLQSAQDANKALKEIDIQLPSAEQSEAEKTDAA